VLATDWSPDAVRATAANAQLNEVAVETAQVAWGAPGPIVERGPWRYVLASDVLYEPRNVDLLLELLPLLVDETGLVMIADPGRKPAERFLEQAVEDWERKSTDSPRAGHVKIHRLRRRARAGGRGR
jgi:predicted nicotinamide N-methyase